MDKLREFPKGFLWGAATSAYQCEGAALTHGKGPSQQDIVTAQLNERFGFINADITSDFYHKYKEYIALFKEMGMNSYRFSISWSRIFPQGCGAINQEGVQFYHDVLDELIHNEITPIVTIYHFDCPYALVKKYGGWISRDIVADFEAYATFVINEYKDKVQYWTTMNEQSMIVDRFENKNLVSEEQAKDFQLRYQSNHYMNLCHAIACNLVHDLVPNGKVGPVLAIGPVYPASSKPEDVRAALNCADLKNYYFTDIYAWGRYNDNALAYLKKHQLAPTIEEGDMDLIASAHCDFLGLNYYCSHCAEYCEEDVEMRFKGVNWKGVKGATTHLEQFPGFYAKAKNPNLETTDWDWPIDPIGMEVLLLDLWERYHLPMMFTENGCASRDKVGADGSIHDPLRIKYYQEHIKAMKRAIDSGVEVISYNPWSAMDLLSTSNGFDKRYGFIYVDYHDGGTGNHEFHKKDSFYFYQKVCQSNGADLGE